MRRQASTPQSLEGPHRALDVFVKKQGYAGWTVMSDQCVRDILVTGRRYERQCGSFTVVEYNSRIIKSFQFSLFFIVSEVSLSNMA